MPKVDQLSLQPLRHRISSSYRRLCSHVKQRIAETIRSLTPHLSYSNWIKHCERPSYQPARITQAIAAFHYTPKVSIVMPVYNTPVALLDLAISSVRAQDYENWELCICDDASPKLAVRARLENWSKQDPRITVTHSTENEGISRASNRALLLASGEFVGLLDHDDELSQNALYEVVKLLQDFPHADMVYSDEDKLDPQGRRIEPYFKPDWSPEYLLSMMYTLHFSVYRRCLLDEIGGFRAGFEGSQDYDLALRITEKTDRIYHIPKVLYHWRMAPGSAAASSEAKPYAYDAARRALTEHLSHKRIPGEILHGKWRGLYRVRFNLQEAERVSIVVPNLGKEDDLKTCVRSIEDKSSYHNHEIVVVANRSIDADTERYLSARSCRIIFADESRNFSRLVNIGAANAQGQYLLILHDDIEVISPDWMAAMLGFFSQEKIGAVGVKLLYRTDRLQHIGIVLGLKGLAGYPLQGRRGRPLGYPDPSDFIRNCSAVSGACMMVRKSVFEAVGGFDEQLPGAYSDIDFCLRIREAGYRIVWTPHAELYHDEPPSRVDLGGSEAKYFIGRWRNILKNDPYYNPNLTLRYEDVGFRV
jgi:GT2 family glycosyltransferase